MRSGNYSQSKIMALDLTNNFALKASPDVKNIVHLFLEKMQLSYFGYCRIYDDGYRINLSNRGEWIKHYFHMDYQNIARLDRHPSCYPTCFVLWDEWGDDRTTHQTVRKDLEENFNISHGLSLMKRGANYCDGFDFGTTRYNTSINSFYLSNIDLFEHFSLHFVEQAKQLIKQAYKDRFFVTYHEGLDIYKEYDDTLSNARNLKILDNYDKSILSSRELSCINWLLKGKTIGELSMILGISQRTTEKHLIHIKEKLDCRTLFQIGNKVSKLGLDKLISHMGF